MTIRFTPKTAFILPILIGLVSVLGPICLAGQFDRDPISEAQTNAVPVTPETLKGEKAGAPAPTYKMVEDSPAFLTPETVDTKAQKKSSKEVVKEDEFDFDFDFKSDFDDEKDAQKLKDEESSKSFETKGL